MTGRTHDLAAFTLLNGVFLLNPPSSLRVSTLLAAWGATMIGGLFPDIDQPTADLYNRIPAGSIVGKIISPFMGSHRMISHSFVGLILTGFLLEKFLKVLSQVVLVDMTIVWWAFMIGVVSHIFIDLFTREGVPLLFPFPWKFGIPPFAFLRIKTGGIVEKTLIYPALLLLNGYLIYRFHDIYLVFFKQYLH